MSEVPEVPTEQHPMDAVITDLRALRAAAGDPSYAELALRITQRRMSSGMTAAAARIPRSTVYDAFQIGRRRINPGLLADIVLALSDDHALAIAFKRRCVAARRYVSIPPSVPVPASSPEQEEHPVITAPAVEAVRVKEVVHVEEAPRAAPIAEQTAVLPARVRVPALALAVLLLACTMLNLLGGWLVMVLRLPLYLDMVGTAIASVVLGPWWGVLVAMGTNGGETVYDGRASLPFVIVNITGALVWGYGVRRFAMGRNVARFFTLNVVVALACTVVAVPILLVHFHGVTRNADSSETLSLASTYHSLLDGLWSSNTLTSLVDKLLCGFGALTAVSAMPSFLTARLPSNWMANGEMRRESTPWTVSPQGFSQV